MLAVTRTTRLAFVPLLSDEEAWRCLPRRAVVAAGPLPAWARALARTLPRTTAAMLDLDQAFRTSPALNPRLAASVRLAVAQALGSRYGRAYAEADLARLDLDRTAIDQLGGDPASLPDPVGAVLRFAARLTLAGSAITDAEVADLVRAFGEAAVVAIVLQVAYSNFRDRLALALGLEVEPDGPIPPTDAQFVADAAGAVPPSPRPPASPSTQAESGAGVHSPLPAGSPALATFAALQGRLEAQRGRQGRVRIPTWDEFRAALPESPYPSDRPLRVRWSLLVCGRQPELGPAWIRCLRVFEAEAQQDRVFEESLFWVVTQSLGCTYCMGHCEMLLAEAGLDPSAIAARTARLGAAEWPGFTRAERVAFAFARQLTTDPGRLSAADVQGLADQFGPERALDVAWWASRCQFMTKVSDAFQLPLERDNVFTDHLATAPLGG